MKAYVYLSRSRDWECFVTDIKQELAADDDLWLAGEVCCLKQLFHLMEDNGFDAEYFYEFVDNCMPHRIYNMLDKEEEDG